MRRCLLPLLLLAACRPAPDLASQTGALLAGSDWTLPSVGPAFASALGDVDGDGVGDVGVGDPEGGSLAIYGGGALVATPIWQLAGAPGDGLGRFVPLGDTNDDGYADFLALALTADVGGPFGAASLWLGGAAGPTAPGWQLDGGVGDAIADRAWAAGDSDGDGFADLVVGSAGLSQVDLYRGSPTGLGASAWTVTGAADFGAAVALADLDSDGFGDVVVGEPAAAELTIFAGSAMAPATSPISLSGPVGSQLGASLVAAGDLDGDGFADVVAGAPGANAGDGALQALLGASLLGDASLGASRPGPQSGGAAGSVLAGLGDANGDGFADVAARVGPTTVAAWFGGPGGLQETPGWTLSGGAAFGHHLSGGDSDGDGFGDLLVSAGEFGSAGSVTRHPGQPTAPVAPLASLGPAASVAMGDVNGDGFDDLLQGDPLYADGHPSEGGLWLTLGTADGPGAPDWTWEPDAPGAFVGRAVAVGDIDGDGYADLLVGAPGWQDTLPGEGALLVFAGGTTVAAGPTVLASGQGAAGRGAAVIFAGDVNGDGYGDALVGAPNQDDGLADAGVVTLFGGSATGLGAPLATVSGAVAGAHLGAAVAGGRDMDGDGLTDILVAAPDDGGGSVQLLGWSGSALTPLWTATGAPGEELGRAVALADLDGDPHADVVVALGGAVRWWSGAAGATAPATTWADPSAGFGAALASEDLDGDGVSGLLVAAPGAGAVLRSAAGEAPAAWYSAPAVALASGDLNGDGAPDAVLAGPAASHWFAGRSGDRSAARRPWAPHVAGPVAPGGRSPSPDGFLVTAAVHSAAGCVPLALQVQVATAGDPLDQGAVFRGPWSPSCVGTMTAAVTGLAEDTPVHWRARTLQRSSLEPGPWARGGPSAAPHLRTGCTGDLDGDGFCDVSDPDADGDGSPVADDCDDLDPAIHPAAAEVTGDGIDQDCNGFDAVQCWPDLDGDTWGPDVAPTIASDGCTGALRTGDCDDTEAAAHPDQTEACDGFDTDCDGLRLPDEADADGDGSLLCDPQPDCDDEDALVRPGGPELFDCVDTDCDGAIPLNETIDGDHDGVAACADCMDDNPTVGPGAPAELCDGFDTDCAGGLPADELDEDGDGARPCAGDCDDTDAATGPGATELSSSPVDRNCDGVTGEDVDGDGFRLEDGDCDDGNAVLNPGAVEVCDASGVDEDCSGAALVGDGWDGDGDGWLACEDCDDTDPAVHPEAEELCDGRDTNCDGYLLLDSTDGVPDEIDGDGDGSRLCDPVPDCDDGDPEVRLGQGEDCTDGRDDDCDGVIDPVGVDADGDGVGPCEGDCDDADPVRAPGHADPGGAACDGLDQDCDGVDGPDLDGDGWTDCAGDCLDEDPERYPGAPAICGDGRDEDCDPRTWENGDLDGDGAAACPDGADCAEGVATVFEGAPELCDGLDNDCDGDVDEGVDVDGDGWVSCRGDCGEGDGAVFPGADEVCGDGVDNDCDRAIDEDCDEPLPLDAFALPPGCYCQSGGSAAPGLLALLALIRRRRREPK